jgi:DNA-binding MarR family transcriptional regulator
MNKKKDIKQLNKTQSTVLGWFAALPVVTLTRIANGIGRPLSTIKRVVKELKIKGLVAREGSDKKGKWVVLDPNGKNNFQEDK